MQWIVGGIVDFEKIEPLSYPITVGLNPFFKGRSVLVSGSIFVFGNASALFGLEIDCSDVPFYDPCTSDFHVARTDQVTDEMTTDLRPTGHYSVRETNFAVLLHDETFAKEISSNFARMTKYGTAAAVDKGIDRAGDGEVMAGDLRAIDQSAFAAD